MVSLDTWNILTIVIAFVENLSCSGLILGWPSLALVLTDAGYFGVRCDDFNAEKLNKIPTERIVEATTTEVNRPMMFNKSLLELVSV